MSTRAILARFEQVARQQRAVEEQQPREAGDRFWMNTETARRYVDKPSRKAFRVWAQRAGITPRRCGRRLLYSKHEIDVALERRRGVVRPFVRAQHAVTVGPVG